MDAIAKLQAGIVALRDQFGGMQGGVRETKSTIKQLGTSMERLDVTLTGAVATLSTMEEAATELGASIATIARKQDEQAQTLQKHEDEINELKKKTGGSP